jgi:hypothetical protein
MVISSSRLAISSLCRLRRLPAYCHLMCRRWYTRLYAGVLASSWGVLPVIATSRSELKPLILCRSVLVSSHPSHPYVIMASRVWSSTRVSHTCRARAQCELVYDYGLVCMDLPTGNPIIKKTIEWAVQRPMWDRSF